jgi:hypothetical protein
MTFVTWFEGSMSQLSSMFVVVISDNNDCLLLAGVIFMQLKTKSILEQKF